MNAGRKEGRKVGGRQGGREVRKGRRKESMSSVYVCMYVLMYVCKTHESMSVRILSVKDWVGGLMNLSVRLMNMCMHTRSCRVQILADALCEKLNNNEILHEKV